MKEPSKPSTVIGERSLQECKDQVAIGFLCGFYLFNDIFMKQIKVNDTRMHKIRTGRRLMYNLPPSKDADEVPVVEGKLVLIEENKEAQDGELVMVHAAFNHISNRDTYWIYKKPPCPMPYWGGNIETYVVVKPIIISETEKIEKGDWIWIEGMLVNYIHALSLSAISGQGYRYKVLVLPEQFSPKQIQAIIDSKMKDGDKVLVECIHKGDYDEYLGHGDKDARIALNSQGHVTLHKVEEKMYTREEVYDFILNALAQYRIILETGDVWRNWDTDKWFEQNVK